jgi:hypothetical protein
MSPRRPRAGEGIPDRHPDLSRLRGTLHRGCPGMRTRTSVLRARGVGPGRRAAVRPLPAGGPLEEDLKNDLYKSWNRMSSGTYFPPAVKAVEIPKPHGGGTRILGVPTVADRIAQTVVAMRLEARTELIFHPDSYGYRPRKSAHDALKKCRERCWRKDWVLDLDIRKFFDSLDHDLVIKGMRNAERRNGAGRHW